MADHHLDFDEENERLLARVQAVMGIATLEETVEVLAKSSLRRYAEQANGRRRKLALVAAAESALVGAGE